MTFSHTDASIVEHTTLWKTTLASDERSSASVELQKQQLRNIFYSFRKRSAELVEHIFKDLPQLTVHDISHLDALWEMADVITGCKKTLSPIEAFVFGGAVLLHDAALSLSAYPGGLEEMKKTDRWKDGVTAEYRKLGKTPPSEEGLNSPEESIRDTVLFDILRSNHARQAESLATQGWVDPSNADTHYLIEDIDARNDLGLLIGQLAHSHWWSIDQLERTFAHSLNPPAWCRHTGTLRPLVIASLLRCVDAIHLDARRAPRLRRALVNPTGIASHHWLFQGKLSPPTHRGDAVYFTGGPFSPDEYDAWWLCHDTLLAANKELESAYTLLSDHGEQPFLARRIYGIQSLNSIKELVTTSGWTPVDTTVRITNVPAVVVELGANSLYRKSSWSVLRELIQNAADAIRARRAIEQRPDDWGEISVSLQRDSSDGINLCVTDCGMGMTEYVLREYLLDFFKSYWNSPDAISDSRGRLRHYTPTGRYGIGFYSVFMVAHRVSVHTRSCLRESNVTRSLVFRNGVSSRPLLSDALDSSSLPDPGTEVSITFRNEQACERMLKDAGVDNLFDLIGFVAPALDVKIVCHEDGEPPRATVLPNDWKSISASDLLSRIDPQNRMHYSESAVAGSDESRRDVLTREIARHEMRTLAPVTSGGDVIGRLTISRGMVEHKERTRSHVSAPSGGVMVCGGLRVGKLCDFSGVIEGSVLDASRNRGEADASVVLTEEFVDSLEERIADSMKSIDRDLFPDASIETFAIDSAQFLAYIGGNVAKLPVGWHQERGYLTLDDLDFLRDHDQVYFVDSESYKTKEKRLTKKELYDAIRSSRNEAANIAFDYSAIEVGDNVLVVPFRWRQQRIDDSTYHIGQHGRIVTEVERSFFSYEHLRDIDETAVSEGRSTYAYIGLMAIAKRLNLIWGGSEDKIAFEPIYSKELAIPCKGEIELKTDGWAVRKCSI